MLHHMLGESIIERGLRGQIVPKIPQIEQVCFWSDWLRFQFGSMRLMSDSLYFLSD
jgi:hypothetical protein